MQPILHRHIPKAFLSLLCAAAALGSRAQTVNKPRLDLTAPADIQSNSIPTPPAITVNTSELYNYVRSFTPRLPIDDAAQLSTATAPANTAISTKYTDGFGRSMQVLQHNFTPGRSLVSPSDTRFRPTETGYLPYTVQGFGFRASAFSEQQAYYSGLYPGEGTNTALSSTSNTSTTGERSVAAAAPGLSQVGQSRVTKTVQATNNATEVRTWSLDANGKPVSSGAYPAGQLFAETVTLPAGNVFPSPYKRVFKDRDGRVVLEQTADSSYVASSNPYTVALALMSTYYVYNDLGQLSYILPPVATDLAAGNSWTIDNTMLDQYCFQYRYDDKGRKVEQKLPGKEWEYFVYDKRNRLVFYQDGKLRSEDGTGWWAFTFYDPLDRPTMTGRGQAIGATRQQTVTAVEDNSTYPTNHWMYYVKNYDLFHAYPSSLPYCDIWSYTYYDDYREADASSSLWNTFAGYGLQSGELQYPNSGAETPKRSDRIQGMVTGSRVKILPSPGADPAVTAAWRSTALFYDDKGRLIYSASKEWDKDKNVLHESYFSMQYSFIGQTLATKQKHFNYKSTDGHTEHTEVNKNEYEPATGRLSKTWRRVDDATAWTLTSSYTYDDLGRVQRKVLGNNGEVQDLTYNIRGQLTGINGIYAETGNKQGQNLTFGESLKYDYGFDRPRYDGKIAGMIWRGSDITRHHTYGYDYDLSGRLKSADYYSRVPSVPLEANWNKTVLDFSVSNLFYDRNGNIKSMTQRGVDPGNDPFDMDILRYTYKGNQLMAVADASISGDFGGGDFLDGSNSGNDYNYDPNGNLSQDLNKDISGIRYNHFNKPVTITWNSGKKIEYSYDAGGVKVQELIFDPGKPTKRTDYVGNFVYQNDTLQYALTADGRTAFNYTTANPVKEEYFVKDHLGNVRSTIDIVTYGIRQYLAGYEVASANLEGLLFEKVGEIRDDKPGSTDPGDVKAGRLNGAEAGREVGTSLLVKVMAGDQVDLNVNNYYEGFNSEAKPLSPDQMLQSVISTLTGGVGGFPGESHNTELVGQLFTPSNFTMLDKLIQDQGIDPNKPQAGLTYALFDENMKLVKDFSGAYQVNGEGSWGSIGSNGARVIPANGYLAVYLSSRHQDLQCLPCGNIFFDKLKVEISKGNLLAEDHYYPHGLAIKALSSALTSLEGFRENRRKYQSNEYIQELGLNWMSFGARQYDPQIGRFLSVDPLAFSGGQQIFSPYAAMGNAPESMVDPNGTIFTLSSKTFVDDLKESYISKINKNQQEIDNLKERLSDPNLSKREIKNINQQIDKLSNNNMEMLDALQEIDKLSVSSQVYDIRYEEDWRFDHTNPTSQRESSKTMFNFRTGVVEIILSVRSNGKTAHELTHAYQFETGEFSIGPALSNTEFKNFLYDKYDELKGYKREELFMGSHYSNPGNLPKEYSNIPTGPYDYRNVPALNIILTSPQKLQRLADITGHAFRINGVTYYKHEE